MVVPYVRANVLHLALISVASVSAKARMGPGNISGRCEITRESQALAGRESIGCEETD